MRKEGSSLKAALQNGESDGYGERPYGLERWIEDEDDDEDDW